MCCAVLMSSLPLWVYRLSLNLKWSRGVVIVDVGINAVEGGLVGDVDPAVSAKASAFTPVQAVLASSAI